MEPKYIPSDFIPRTLLNEIVFNAIKVQSQLQKSVSYQYYSFRLLFTFIVDSEYENEIDDLKQRIHSAIDTDLIPIGIRVLTMKDLEDSE